MFNIILLTVVTLNGSNVLSYEKVVMTNFPTLAECRAAMNYAQTQVPSGDFVFTTTGFCSDGSNMAAFDWVKDRAKAVNDKTGEILMEAKRTLDLERERRKQEQKQNYAPKPNYPQRNYLLNKEM